MNSQQAIGAVIIGRNEGGRLVKAINSIVRKCSRVVYVDSGSTDNSFSVAKELGIESIQLDMTVPFTAGRARNEGCAHLLKKFPEIKCLQFIDGDCEVVDGWILSAEDFLNKNDDVAIVCGRRRERFPESTIYNHLCDIEWDTPIGQSGACGGDFMIRASVFKDVNGFNPSIIAGEEPDMCFRIREKKWKVWRLDAEMTMHDANITKFSQWWLRCKRSGHAYAEGAYMHGKSKEQFRVRECIRIFAWGFLFPIVVFLLSNYSIYTLSLLLFYPLQILRIVHKNNLKISIPWSYSFFLMLGKFPEMQGQFKFLLNKVVKSQSSIIEYK